MKKESSKTSIIDPLIGYNEVVLLKSHGNGADFGCFCGLLLSRSKARHQAMDKAMVRRMDGQMDRQTD